MTLIELLMALSVCGVLALVGRLLLGDNGLWFGVVPALLLYSALLLCPAYAALSKAWRRRRDR
jgi:prepilin-type N-terminal cleavage/methylation domain-containing protein